MVSQDRVILGDDEQAYAKQLTMPSLSRSEQQMSVLRLCRPNFDLNVETHPRQAIHQFAL